MEDIFEGLRIPERVAMLESAKQTTYQEGQFIIKEDTRNDTIFGIVEGEVQVVIGAGENATEVARLGAGAIFGEMSFLAHTTTSASIIAAGEVELICVSHQTIAGMMEKDPEFAGRFYRSLACTLVERLRRANQRK